MKARGNGIFQVKYLAVFLALWLVCTAGYVYYTRQNNALDVALARAEAITVQVMAGREVYTSMVVHKLEQDGTGAHQFSDNNKGYVMLPAQLMRNIAQQVSLTSNAGYSYQLISEWNINPDQNLREPFDIWAWQRLREQESEFKVRGTTPGPAGFPWKPVYRVERQAGGKMLRYMQADPASAVSCVQCHNALEKRPEIVEQRRRGGDDLGKQWALHELMGALSLKVPLGETGNE